MKHNMRSEKDLVTECFGEMTYITGEYKYEKFTRRYQIVTGNPDGGMADVGVYVMFIWDNKLKRSSGGIVIEDWNAEVMMFTDGDVFVIDKVMDQVFSNVFEDDLIVNNIDEFFGVIK